MYLLTLYGVYKASPTEILRVAKDVWMAVHRQWKLKCSMGAKPDGNLLTYSHMQLRSSTWSSIVYEIPKSDVKFQWMVSVNWPSIYVNIHVQKC